MEPLKSRRDGRNAPPNLAANPRCRFLDANGAVPGTRNVDQLLGYKIVKEAVTARRNPIIQRAENLRIGVFVLNKPKNLPCVGRVAVEETGIKGPKEDVLGTREGFFAEKIVGGRGGDPVRSIRP
jgi:hypothetical protein